jgi:hypothetical protein
MARRDLRPVVARHVALDADRSFYGGGAYVVAGAGR